MNAPLEVPTTASPEAIELAARLPRFGDSGPTPEAIPYALAALYSPDCAYPADRYFPGYAERWDADHRHWYTQTGSHQCQLVDWQPDTPIYTDPAGLRRWVQARRHQPAELGNRSIIYTDRSDARAAWFATEGLDPYWLIATLDGIVRTPAELAAELDRVFRAPIPADHIWAQQVTNHGSFDENVLFGSW